MPFPTYNIPSCNMATLRSEIDSLSIAGFLGINAAGADYTVMFSAPPSAEDQGIVDTKVAAHDPAATPRWGIVSANLVVGLAGVLITSVTPAWQDLGGMTFHPGSEGVTRVQALMACNVVEDAVGGGAELRVAELADNGTVTSLMAAGPYDLLDNSGTWGSDTLTAASAPSGVRAQFILQGRLKNAADVVSVRLASLQMLQAN